MKNLKYLAALSIPITVIIGLSFKGWWSFFTPIYSFAFIPLLELILPQDNANFSEKEKESKQLNKLFDWMLYINVPIVYGVFVFSLFEITTTSLFPYELFGLSVSVGMMLGTNGINVGHELGHRQTSSERFLGKLLLLPSLYMHFYIEHNFGHHKHAATKEDPATARYNQSVYSFWFSSIFRQYKSAWSIQLGLLKKYDQPFLSFKIDRFWYLMLQLGYLTTVYVFFGYIVLLFAITSAISGILLLETVNYIDHYGLLRKKNDSGRYERVKEVHSWKSNHVVGRIILYELTRHSDHHYKASKKYQVLECYKESPQLPFGYPTSMVIALIPPLWFSIMNKRVPKEMVSL